MGLVGLLPVVVFLVLNSLTWSKSNFIVSVMVAMVTVVADCWSSMLAKYVWVASLIIVPRLGGLRILLFQLLL